MKLHCALCGRSMDQAAVLVGTLPVGPKCAQRAGLMPLAKRKSGLVFQVMRKQIVRPKLPETIDMFEGVQ